MTLATATTITLGGWISLTLSIGFVTTLFIWCVTRILRNKPPQK